MARKSLSGNGDAGRFISGRRRPTGTSTSRRTRRSSTTRQAPTRCTRDQAGYADADGDGVREDPATGDPLELLVPASRTRRVRSGCRPVRLGLPRTDRDKRRIFARSRTPRSAITGVPQNLDALIWYWSGDPDPNCRCSCSRRRRVGASSDGSRQTLPSTTLYEQQRSVFDREERQAVVQKRLSSERTNRSPASCSRIQVGSRPTEATGSRAGSRASPSGYLMPGYNYGSLVGIHPVSAAGADIERFEPGSRGDVARRSVRSSSPWVSGSRAHPRRRELEETGRRRGGTGGPSPVRRTRDSCRRYRDLGVRLPDVQLLLVPRAAGRPGGAARSQRLTDQDVSPCCEISSLDLPMAKQYLTYLGEIDPRQPRRLAADRARSHGHAVGAPACDTVARGARHPAPRP